MAIFRGCVSEYGTILPKVLMDLESSTFDVDSDLAMVAILAYYIFLCTH